MTTTLRSSLLALALLCAASGAARAQYWSDRLPATHYVDKTNQGTDARDTALRQAAAYAVLRHVIETAAGSHAEDQSSIPGHVRPRWQEYVTAEQRVIAAQELMLDDVAQLANDFAFRQTLVTKYFDGRDRERYLKRQWREQGGHGTDTAQLDRALAEGQLRAFYALIPEQTREQVERYALIAASPLLLLLLFGTIAVARELTGTYGLRGSPARLASGWQESPLRTFTGVLVESGRTAMLRDREGREHAVAPIRANALSSREGHVVSAVWMQRDGGAPGRDLVLRNHTTDQVSYDEAALRSLLKPRGAVHGFVWVAALAFAAWSLLGPVVYVLATRTASSEPFKTQSVMVGLAAVALAPIVTGVWRSIVANARVAGCKRQLRSRLLPSLDLDADDLLPR